MKTYEQGRAELDAELKRLNNAIKDAKQNITFDFHCPQCNKTKKIRVHCSTTGRGGAIIVEQKPIERDEKLMNKLRDKDKVYQS